MSLRIEPADGLRRIAVEGELNIFHAAEYHRELLESCPADARLIVDLSLVGELDSAGLQLLLALEKHAAAGGGSLALSGRSAVVESALGAFNLTQHFATAEEVGHV